MHNDAESFNPEAVRAQMLAAHLVQSSYAEGENLARRQTSLGMFVVALAVVGIATSAVIGVSRGDFNRGQNWIGYLAVLASFVIVLSLGSLIVMRSSSLRSEINRSRRQFSAIESYVADLPPEVAALVKATLAPRVFTEVGADEPWSAPNWPPSSDLVKLLDDRNVE
jgi:hypothetical protein